MINKIYYFTPNNKLSTENEFKAQNLPVKIIIHGWNDMQTSANAQGWANDIKNTLFNHVKFKLNLFSRMQIIILFYI